MSNLNAEQPNNFNPAETLLGHKLDIGRYSSVASDFGVFLLPFLPIIA
jgi:hypothetical protein